jgi:hypothetical protein
MKHYSIVQVGNDYVVRAGDVGILKVASRRQAVELVCDAAELLKPAPQPVSGEDSSSAGEGADVTPDPRGHTLSRGHT